MTIGGSERHNFIISVAFQDGDVAARALRAGQAAHRAYLEGWGAGKPFNIADVFNEPQAMTELQRIGRRFSESLRESMQLGLGQYNRITTAQGTPGPVPRGPFGFAANELSPNALKVLQQSLQATADANAYYIKNMRLAATMAQEQALESSKVAKAAREAAEAEDDSTLKAQAEALAKHESAEAEKHLATATELLARARTESARLGVRNEETKAQKSASRLADAQEKEAQQIEETSQARELLGRGYNTRARFEAPDVTTDVGKAQQSYNAALRRAADAVTTREGLLQQALAGEYVSIKEATAANERVAASTEGFLRAQEQLRIAELKATGTFAQQFALGFKGETQRPYAEQLGQAFKFSIFYGTAYRLLSGITQTFQATLQEGIAFQQAVTELKLSSGDASDSMDALANQLGQTAVAAGQAPSEGVLIGARSLGLYGVTQAPGAEQARVAQASADVVSKLALASGQAADDLQTNVAAIVNAFGGGPESQYRVGDLDAYMAHRFGIAPGSTIAAVSEAGTVGAAAGFSQEQVNAIAAALMARTGQTAPAVAGFMAQIFSRGGEGSLTAVTQRYGIDPNATLAQQISELAEVYKTATAQERAQLSAAFGRGKVQNAAIALLQSFPEVQRAAGAATSGAATGALDDAFNKRLDNIGGQLALTGSELKEFANQLGQTGLLDILGGAVVAFREIVHAGNELLEVWNHLDRAVKDVIVGLGLLYAAAKATAIVQGEGGAVAAARTALTGGGLAGGSVRGLVTGAGGAGGLVSSVGSLGVAAAVMGDVVLWSRFRDASQRMTDSQNAYADFLTQHQEDLNTSEGAQARASLARQREAGARDAAGGFFANVIDLGKQSDQQDAIAEAADKEAGRLEAGARYLKAQEDSLSSVNALITGFDAESLKSSLDQITTSGGTAKEQLDALTAAVKGSGDAAARAAANYDPHALAFSNAQGAYEALGSSFYVGTQTNLLGKYVAGPLGISPGMLGSGKDLTQDILLKAVDQSAIQDRMQTALSQINSLGDLDPETMRQIATEIVGSTPEDVVRESDGALKASDVPKLRQSMVDSVKHVLENMKDTAKYVADQVVLTQGELTSLADSILQTVAARLQEMPQSSHNERIAELGRRIKTLQQGIAKTPGGATPKALYDLQQLMNQQAEEQYAQLDAFQKAAESRAHTKAQLQQISAHYTRLKIQSAVQHNDADLLSKILSESNASEIQVAQEAIKTQEEADRAKHRLDRHVARQKRVVAHAIFKFNETVRGMMGDLFGGASDLSHLLLDPLYEGSDPSKGIKAPPKPDRSGVKEAVKGAVPDPNAGGADTATAGQIAAARAAAQAARDQGGIAAAHAQIVAAKNAMHDAAGDQVAYFQALGELYQAQQALNDAIVSYRQNLFLLGHDITNPLVQARAALRAAAQTLANDRREGAGPDQIAADRVALQQQQAQVESTKFNQRLQAVQTAEELGRISHSAYIRYLDNEKARLESIKHRSYQQQQELNQVDQLLQSAAKEMEGQWNFGDIKLPTPYQMRRIVAERSSQLTATQTLHDQQWTNGNARSGGDVYFDIDGADTAKVEKIIRDVVGGQSTIHVRSHSARRRT